MNEGTRGWSEGTALLNNCFGLFRMITIFQDKIIPNILFIKGVGSKYA